MPDILYRDRGVFYVGGGVEEAPIDGKLYARKKGMGRRTSSGGGGAVDITPITATSARFLGGKQAYKMTAQGNITIYLP
jgi:hypothetical protein